MNYILSARADSIAINITLNSFDTFYNQPSHRASSRKSLYPSFGTLYPAGTEALVRSGSCTHTHTHVHLTLLIDSLVPFLALTRVCCGCCTRGVCVCVRVCVQSKVEDDEGITRVLHAYPQYRAIWESAEMAEGGERLVDDAFFLRNVRVLEMAFSGQFHYGMFYAFVKLKEQEVKNLVRDCRRAVCSAAL
jgi:V-type H+-transporting ATPase subunit d